MTERSRASHLGWPFLRGAREPHAKAEGDEQALPADSPLVDQVQQTLEGLEKQIGRMDREQFKARALTEAQIEQFNAALELLRAGETRREAELASLQAQSQAARTAARLEVVQSMLPALDGLDEALRSGRVLLEAPAPAAPRRTLLDRLLAREAPSPGVDAGFREALAAWLNGLTFVRERLLDVLATEGVRPVIAEGHPFDPHVHVALEVVPSSQNQPPGTVVAQLRQGYLVGDRVLRYAEVAVAGENGA